MLDGIQTTKRKRGVHTCFRSFSEARAFVHTLRLPNSVEYHRWARGNDGLEDIPVNPNLVYDDCGWQGWADWLGYSYRSSKKPFIPYEAAKAFVHALQLPTKEAFDRWAASNERAAQIPACPHITYKKSGWRDWQDFLGYERPRHGRGHFLPFQEARAWAHAQQFPTSADWHRMRAQGLLPDNIPTSPNQVYQQFGWVSWQDWVGCLPRNERWRSFEEARELVRSLNFRDAPTYKKWAMTSERPVDVPAAPHYVYQNRGWTDWYDWLGHSKSQTPRQYLSFDEARTLIHQQGFIGFSGWAEWCRDGFRPNNIPSNPASFYRGQGWHNWPDFLGTVGQPRRRRPKQDCWRSFQEARQFVHTLRLWSIQAWNEWCATSARPHDVPEHPDYVYRNEGWAGWRDFLGKIPSEDAASPGLSSRKWRTFEEARGYVKALKLTGIEQWRQWADSSEKPFDIPKTPSYAYRDLGWAGMSDWLGLEPQTGRPKGSKSGPPLDSQQLFLEDLFDLPS